jgi:multiple antibiotic resistance protein
MAEALVSFFAIIDPLGSILVFHLFTQGFSQRDKLLAALLAVTAAFVMLAGFSLGGSEVLAFLGIEAGSFRVAAGLLLMLPAYRLITEGQPATVESAARGGPLEFALVPLATPLIAGPGALAATTSFSQTVGRETTIAAVSIVLLLTFAAFATADWLFRLAGAAFLRLVARIVGILLFAIAVDFVLDGVREFIDSTSL